MTLKELRRATHEKLRLCTDIDSPFIDADLIIMYVLGLDKTGLLTKNMNISNSDAAKISELIEKRLSGTPVQYLIEKCEFMSLEFKVDENVLIPRSDTEILVEAIIEKYRSYDAPIHILDIGCGSGCIGISLTKNLPNCTVTEVDISKPALKLARENAKRHQVETQISFVNHDILSGDFSLSTPPDCIVSNPPYIRTGDLSHLQREVILHEPRLALDGGDDGLMFYRKIIKDIHPKKDGITAFEAGYDQADDIKEIMLKYGYKNIEYKKDLAGINRVVLGYYE